MGGGSKSRTSRLSQPELAHLATQHAQRCRRFAFTVARRRGLFGEDGRRVAFARSEKKIVFQVMLLGVEIEISALGGEQFLVTAVLHDLSVLHHQNLVGSANGRKAVRDYERST